MEGREGGSRRWTFKRSIVQDGLAYDWGSPREICEEGQLTTAQERRRHLNYLIL